MTKQPLPFQFIGNDLVLDFVNTRVAVGTQDFDLIETRDQLANWLNDVGLQTSLEDWSDHDIGQLFVLRDAFQDVMHAAIDGAIPDTDALACINSHLKRQVTQSHLTYDGSAFHIDENKTDLTAGTTMSHLANRAAVLLATTDPDRIKTCAGPQCVLIFKDTSKSGRRKWCSMDSCGNRTKASKFRATHTAG